MSQGSLILPTTGTVSGLTLAQDINAALANLASFASGSTDPSGLAGGVQPYSFWADESVTPNLLRQRNFANNGWNLVGDLTQPNLGLLNQAAGDARYSLNGQCRLAKSGANIVLSAFNGNKLSIAGAVQTVPSAGVSLAPTGLLSLTATTTRSIAANVATVGHAALASAIPVGTNIFVRDLGGAAAYNGAKTVTASTTTSTSYAAVAANEASTADTNGRVLPIYYIYAYMNAGTMTLEASTVSHTTDASTGNEIKSGDATRSLVGMAALVAGGFVDSLTQHFVSSWFNRAPVFLRNNFTAARSTTSSTIIEINSEIRVETLAWLNDVYKVSMIGGAAVAAGSALGSAVIFQDQSIPASALAGTGTQIQVPGNGANNQLYSVPIAAQMSEGYHYFTVGGDVGSGSTITYSGGATIDAFQLYASN